MSDGGDYDDEMLWNRSISDDAVEDLLAGNSHDTPLAPFVADARAAVGGPVPVPSGELEALFQSGVSVASVTSIDRPATARRRRMPVPAGLAALPFAAKIALGVGVAAAATTGAGVAGVLPPPAQHAVESVVETVTPFSINHGDTPTQSDFGTGVGTDARDETPGVDGSQVGTDARNNGDENKADAPGGVQVPTSLPSQAANGAANSGVTIPPVSTPQVSTPPLSTPPVVVPPVGGVPAVTPPVPVPPVGTPRR